MAKKETILPKAGRAILSNPQKVPKELLDRLKTTKFTFLMDAEHHKRLKMYACINEKTVAEILRDYIDSLVGDDTEWGTGSDRISK